MKKAGVRSSIDLGSSYFRLLVVEGEFPPDERPIVHAVFEDKRFIGWGRDLQGAEVIPPARIACAERSLVGLVRAARERGCDTPVLVGTNVLRAARNSREVARRLSRAVSLPVHVLSLQGEAARGYLGAASHLSPSSPLLLFDPGGTSTEISWGIGGHLHNYTSIPVGTHSVAYSLGRHARQRMRGGNMMALASRQYERWLRGVQRVEHVSRLSQWRETPTILATGGTAVSLAVLKRFMRGDVPVFSEMEALTVAELQSIGRRLAGLLAGGHRRRLPLDRGRVDLIMPGLLLIRMLVERMGIGYFKTTSRDLRWGVVLTDGRFEEREIF